MHLLHVAAVLLFALAVALGGLFLLAYAKKENLGKIYSITALVAVIFAATVFVFGSAGAALSFAKGKKGGKKKNKMEKMMRMHQMHGMGGNNMMWMGHGGGSECGMGGGCPMMKGHCDMSGGKCEMKGEMKCMHGDMKCDMMGGKKKMDCCKDGKCKMHGGGMKKEITVEVETKDGKTE